MLFVMLTLIIAMMVISIFILASDFLFQPTLKTLMNPITSFHLKKSEQRRLDSDQNLY